MAHCCRCGQQSTDGSSICPTCATRPGRRCSACGQYAPAGNRFCGQCGARLTDALTVEPGCASLPIHTHGGDEVSGRRREVTVLFVDITNFTAASRTLDSEEVFVWMDENLRLLTSVVHKYEGAIDKYTGDGLMALFGAPTAHENDPELAVRAALEMQAVIQPLRERVLQKHGFDFQTRIGINTGQVVAGNVGDTMHTEYTVLGDTVNVASRLERAADPGTILVSDATYQRTQPLFVYEVLPPLRVKGLEQPLQAFRPLHPRERPGSLRGLPGLEAPLIGRAHLLGELLNSFEQVRQTGRAHVALVSGEAGLGKSRLIAEFRRRLPETEVRFCQGACLAYARSTPLWVIAAVLRDLVRIPATDPASIQREMLRAYVSQLGINPQNVLPYLHAVLGLEQSDPEAEERMRQIDPAALQRQTHAALRQIMVNEAQRTPTVLVFDDLHWVDPASRDFLVYLLQTVADVSLMLIGITRDADQAAAAEPLIVAAQRYNERCINLQLEALSQLEAALLVDQLIADDTPTAQKVKQRVVQRGSGNPFYTEEIVRVLIDQGGLTAIQGAWHATSQAEDLLLQVPATLQGLILTRFDRLPEAFQRTLQKASVIGRSFPASLLQILDAVTPTTLAAQCDELVSRQFLVAEPFGWATGYAFRHVLIQEAVYGTLLKRDRQRLHEQVAQLIERTAFWPQEEQAEVLAYHYSLSTSPVKAVPYLIDAAENAARHCTNEIAITHYRRALGLMPVEPSDFDDDYFRLRAGLGQALKFVGHFAEASNVLSEALDRLRSSARRATERLPLLIAILRELADIRQREGAYDQAIASLQNGLHALSAAGIRPEPRLWRALMERMAWVRFRQGNPEAALAIATSAVEGVRAEYTDDPITLAGLYNTIGGILWQRGDLTGAIAYVERSLTLYKRLHYIWGMANAYTNLGVLYYSQSLWQRAAHSFEQADALRREHGYIPERSTNLKNLGLLYLVSGNHERAAQALMESLAISQEIGDEFGIVGAEVALLQLALTRRDLVAAATHAAEAQRLLHAASEDEVIQFHWLMALLYAERADIASGLHHALHGLRRARASRSSEHEPDCLRALGVVHLRAGTCAKALAALRAAYAAAHRRNDPYRQGLALLELGRLYAYQDDSRGQRATMSEARAAYTGAVALFDRLGAAHELKIARTALARAHAQVSQEVEQCV